MALTVDRPPTRTPAPSTEEVERAASSPDLRRLRWFNLAMGLLHAGQAAVLVALSNDFALPVTRTEIGTDPAQIGSQPPTPEVVFEVRFGWAAAAFLAISALAHLVLAGPAYRWYVGQLRREVNAARWIEYSFSSSLMVVLIAMLTGVFSLAALAAIAAVNAAMILFGWTFERVGSTEAPDWQPYWFGCLAGAVPWVIIASQLAVAGDAPTFVYAIFASLFVFFMSFAVVPVLQYRRIGPWRDYRVGEVTYIVLSLTAKSALAWQIFAGTLR